MIPIRGRKLIGQDNLNDNLSPSVKLNNPLMGTETLLWPKLHTDFIKSTVKLNDPLMETETHHIDH